MIAISIAPSRFTHGLIAGAGEFALSWPGEDQAEPTLYCGTHSGRTTDKFAAMRFTVRPARKVRAPLIAECAGHLECRVCGRLETGDHTIFAAEVLCAWLADPPRRLLCSINPSPGAEILLQKGGYSFGVVR
jgi:flavin reductase (DIM6/NTAB) family NADH-FMN oxidoreductase RutF